jgi:hypothetical protein
MIMIMTKMTMSSSENPVAQNISKGLRADDSALQNLCECSWEAMSLAGLEGWSKHWARQSGLTSVRLQRIGSNLRAGDSVGDEGGVV